MIWKLLLPIFSMQAAPADTLELTLKMKPSVFVRKAWPGMQPLLPVDPSRKILRYDNEKHLLVIQGDPKTFDDIRDVVSFHNVVPKTVKLDISGRVTDQKYSFSSTVSASNNTANLIQNEHVGLTVDVRPTITEKGELRIRVKVNYEEDSVTETFTVKDGGSGVVVLKGLVELRVRASIQ